MGILLLAGPSSFHQTRLIPNDLTIASSVSDCHTSLSDWSSSELHVPQNQTQNYWISTQQIALHTLNVSFFKYFVCLYIP